MGNQIIYSSTDLINNHRVYNDYLQMGVDDGWGTEDKLENFRLMLEIAQFANAPIEKSTVLDVGCGTGDLVSYLASTNIQAYTGIDVFTPAIEKARQKYAEHTFIADDFLKHTFRKKFDFVFCSGALTTKLSTDNYEIIESWIPKMWRLSRKGVAFNFLAENGQSAVGLFLYDADRVLTICRTQIPEAKIKTITTSAGIASSLQEMHVFLYK